MSSLKQDGKEPNKKFTIRRIFNSMRYSIQGLVYAYTNEQSLLLHGVCTLIVILIGILLQISFTQWVIILLADAVLLSIELLNTAIEATVDMFTKEFHPKAKIAKDCGSAAAFVTGVAFAVICSFIFINELIIIFS